MRIVSHKSQVVFTQLSSIAIHQPVLSCLSSFVSISACTLDHAKQQRGIPQFKFCGTEEKKKCCGLGVFSPLSKPTSPQDHACPLCSNHLSTHLHQSTSHSVLQSVKYSGSMCIPSVLPSSRLLSLPLQTKSFKYTDFTFF